MFFGKISSLFALSPQMGERLLGKKDGNAGGREMDAEKPARGGLEKMRQGIAAKYHSG